MTPFTPIPESPSLWRNRSRWNVARFWNWTLRRRLHEFIAKQNQRELAPVFTAAGAQVTKEAGSSLPHTAVTEGQLKTLLAAVAASNSIDAPIVEIGSFRGVTTKALAAATQRTVVAVDPYLGEGGHEKDFALFREHTGGMTNVRHVRDVSDSAFTSWNGEPVSLVFIDAIHEYLHAWYDFAAWGSLVAPSGFVAFHDVDAFPGVNRVCQRVLKECPQWKPWAYAPNIAIFQRCD
ncbi:class I SAM-dependent methyltransferase [Roseimicrobium sp. ORNL1]|uniref:class I SAM-dependent methyltransferase n=1 Tax=Roseimicrobium sp. ORNL1 TaxID=2711231 RepID=UPI0013E153A8|nr:class I SAM-dependent methyltransferase [Roseimicrobium sp. ORNL1]QIF03899.1 class I SAM-dependent methyltransferase [Roseimicrobium sp. ORNL1]